MNKFLHMQGFRTYEHMCRVLHYRNKHWSEAARERDASQLLQKAWEQSELPDYIRRNLKLENMIYVDCMRVAAAHGPTAGKVSCHLHVPHLLHVTYKEGCCTRQLALRALCALPSSTAQSSRLTRTQHVSTGVR